MCRKNGVADITEVLIGYDGIVIANSKKHSPYALTLRQVFLALAKEIPTDDGKLTANPYTKWSDVDPSLPAEKIEVLGPPPTSGTRDAFVELAMEAGCKSWDWVKALKKSDKNRYKAICHSIREDGAYVEAGENDNLIVQKLDANPTALGIFGFSFLDQNLDKLHGATIEGVEPSFDNIAEQSYPVSRPLFFYVKDAHANVIPGIKEYVAEFTSDRAWGDEGYLSEIGLIPLPNAERDKVGREARTLAANVK